MMFAFKLALALGMTVRELLHRIDAVELQQWMQYYKYDPFGLERFDWHSARISLQVAHSAGIRRAKFEDFMPKFKAEPDKPKQSTEQMRDQFRRAAKVFNRIAGRGKK